MNTLDPEPLLPMLRRLAERLLVPELPPVVRVRQPVEAPRQEDLDQAVCEEVAGVLRSSGRAPGPVAVGVGSRGIAGLEEIVRAVVGTLKAGGWQPFIVPAMGSHGAATAEGQAEVLAGYGITEARVGAPVRATMETVVVGEALLGVPWHADRLAVEAGAVFLVARVKPHTSFRGPVESGPAKMCAIGLGKQPGAQVMHAAGAAGLTERVPASARLAERSGLLLGALAIVENQRDQTALVRGLSAAEVGAAAESRLLAKARELMPRLPFREIDVLLVDRMGKDISGTGMDTNVISRFRIVGQPESGTPLIHAIAVMALSPQSHGNAMGIGNADYVPARLLAGVDLEALYTNALTAGQIAIERPHLPMVLADDRDAVRAAVTAVGRPPAETRLAWIQDTLHTEVMAISPALLGEARELDLEVMGEPEPLPFEHDGHLRVLDATAT
ncbi:MAG TPA: DUF2088 domain-containing protein [Candidatus Dormibacteraeota bacterium]